MSAREYYPVVCRLDRREHHLLAFTGDEDGVLVTRDQRLVCTRSRAALRDVASEYGVTFEEGELAAYDLDAVALWARKRKARKIDCVLLLNAWNLLADIARSLPSRAEDFRRRDASLNRVYSKLFWGNNVPAVTPVGMRYEPVFSRREAQRLALLLEAGLLTFRQARLSAS